MFKKLVLATSLVFAVNAVADPIILPGGVTVPNPATPNALNGTGNIFNSLDFIQFFEDGNGNVVNIEDQISTDFNDLIGLSLTGYGTLNSAGDPGDFLCPSCTLAFEFGGLDVVPGTVDIPFVGPVPALDLDSDGSFFNVYIVDEVTTSLTDLLTDGMGELDTVAADAFIDDMSDVLFLSGTFTELQYDAELTMENLGLGGLGAGTLTAGIDINDEGPDEGIANGNVLSDTVTQSNLTSFFDAVAFSLSSTFFAVGGDVLTVSQENDGNLSANVVPAPATLGIFGLALMGLGLVRRNKKS